MEGVYFPPDHEHAFENLQWDEASMHLIKYCILGDPNDPHGRCYAYLMWHQGGCCA